MTDDYRTIEPPDAPFRADVVVPGDKSLSHRALILAGMATGRSLVTGLGPGADVASTRRALEMLGVEVAAGHVVSPGVAEWRQAAEAIDCGNSGTTLRLLAGALAGRPFRSVLTGDDSLLRRPMRRLVEPLEALGAAVETAESGSPPVAVQALRPLHGAEVLVPLASAQVRSAVELAAVQAETSSVVDSPPGYRDHTERWLEALGLGERIGATRFRVDPGPVPEAEYRVPGDPSSAAFLWASAAMIPGASVTVHHVSLNPGRIGFLQVLEAMGARIDAEVAGQIHGDPVGNVRVTGHGLFGVEVSGETAVAALDELPLVGVLGAVAEGVTVVRDAAELRHKESDRIATTVELIRSLGGGAEPTEDGFAVVGIGRLEAGRVHSRGDHRIAMAAGVAATRALGPVTIEGAGAASVSWPGFFDRLEAMWSSR